MQLSIIVPVLNEEPNLKELSSRLREVLAGYNGAHELIFVDDGSTDKSRELLEEIGAVDPHIRLIKLNRHYGKSTALQSGFKNARGEYVVTMDADLQDDPLEVPNLITKLEEGYDVVSAWRNIRRDRLSKVAGSQLFNKVVSSISGIKIHDTNSGLKAYRRNVVKTIKLSAGMYRFIPLLAHFYGFKICELKVRHRPRYRGKSKYGFIKPFSGLYGLCRLVFVLKKMRTGLKFR